MGELRLEQLVAGERQPAQTVRVQVLRRHQPRLKRVHRRLLLPRGALRRHGQALHQPPQQVQDPGRRRGQVLRPRAAEDEAEEGCVPPQEPLSLGKVGLGRPRDRQGRAQPHLAGHVRK